jgi:transmembrane sensor
MTSEISMRYAIRAWTQRHSGTWRDADEAELQKWLASDSEHRDAYEKVRRAWALAGGLQMSAPTAQESAEHTAARGTFVKRTALAAGMVLLAVALGIPLWHSGERWWNGAQIQLTTRKGQPRSFALDDGTTVMLDADSQLTANIGARRRRVSLDRGEALFNVKHDTSRPFEVVTSAGRIQDIGTRFDVDALESATHVSVLEGRVGVLTDKGQVLLVAGQSGGYDNAGDLLPTRPFKADATGWAGGQRHFDHELLGDVLERVARYHAVKFVFSDPRLQDLRVSGTFWIGDLTLFLRTLAAALPIEPRYRSAEQIEIDAAGPPASRGASESGGPSDPH